jgi:SAM-dependent methyltransferase
MLSTEQRFSDRVENYIRFRPRYPSAIINHLEKLAGLTPSSVIADVGSGTGISSAMFLEHGCTVFGIEPNREMREAAERLLVGSPNFHSVNAPAQATTLSNGCVQLIVAAQAFHWFNSDETRQEFSRILKQDGRVVLIWNERKLDATPFLSDYEALLLRYGTDYAKVRHENINKAALDAFFIGDYTTTCFTNEQRFGFEALCGRLLSSSYAPNKGNEAMLSELRRIFDLHQQDGEVVFLYSTVVHVGQ